MTVGCTGHSVIKPSTRADRRHLFVEYLFQMEGQSLPLLGMSLGGDFILPQNALERGQLFAKNLKLKASVSALRVGISPKGTWNMTTEKEPSGGREEVGQA